MVTGERGSNIMDQCKEMPRAMNQAGPLLARKRTSDMLRQREPGGSNTTDEYKEKFKKHYLKILQYALVPHRATLLPTAEVLGFLMV